MIALITDFGYRDHFVGVLKGVIKGINPGADIIDISHDVAPGSVVNAQFILYSSYAYFPEGTIFLVVVDPGVGTDRRGLIAKGGGRIYVLPDNGIISAVPCDGLRMHTIDMTAFPDASSTFHGRDVFAPVAAGLALGSDPGRFGPLAASAVTVPFPEYRSDTDVKECTIIHIDRFGNAVTSLPNSEVEFASCILYSAASARYRFDAVCVRTYADLYQGQCGMIEGSSGFIEFAMNRSSMADKYGIAIGDRIIMRPLSV